MPNSLSRVATAVFITLLIAAAATARLDGRSVATAAGMPPTPSAAYTPGYTLEGFRWDNRTEVDVAYTWGGGDCAFDGMDHSGPAADIDAGVALQALEASIADINLQLRGGLTLVINGEVSRAVLCSSNSAPAIVVGYGTIASTGLTRSEGLTNPGSSVTSFTSARVFLSNTYAFACPEEPPYRDLQHVITHELLHAIGIGHSEVPAAVMAAVGTACELQITLQPDDIAALAALYTPVLPPPTDTTSPPPASASTGFDRPIAATGVNTALWTGGSVTDLGVATTAAGGVSVAVFSGGRAVIFIPGAPSFVNASFTALFPDGVLAGTILLVVR